MPELPEVETIKNILSRLVVGKTFRDVRIINRNTIEGDENSFRNTLIGRKITAISRLGKFLIFHLDDQHVFLSHLRMEGKYFYHEKDPRHFDVHACVIFTFSDGSVLEYNDTRKFGIMKLDRETTYLVNPPLSNLGPEPFFVKDIDPLYKKLHSKSIAIKITLLDQSFMAGLGNIYVDEVLYKSKIHPETPSKLISKAQLSEIIAHSVEVLNAAIQSGGSTIRSYHPSQGIDGGFQTHLNAYGRENLPCPRCQHPLRKIFVGGRGTTFCPRCQRNPALPYVLGITGPIASGKSSVLSYFANHGYQTLSADAIVADLYNESVVQESLRHLFGDHVMKDGTIDKHLIVNTILDDSSKKRRLEKILHPRVEAILASLIKSMKQDEKLAIEVPLLFESRIDDYCDETIYIDILRQVQKERLALRKMPVDMALALNNGFDHVNDKKKATYVIDNSTTIEQLYKQLAKIVR